MFCNCSVFHIVDVIMSYLIYLLLGLTVFYSFFFSPLDVLFKSNWKINYIYV